MPGVFAFTPKKFGDDRGFFSETFTQQVFDKTVPGKVFVQDNHAYSKDIGVLRGLHYQKPPFAQDKLVRVTRGAVIDTIVDIRKGSPTYGEYLSIELTADNWKQLWVPAGFAHAYCTTAPDTEFCYKVTNYYSPECDAGLAFDDPDLAINWPVANDKLILSPKDRILPKLSETDSPFIFNDNC